MKQLTTNLILTALVGITFLLTTNKETEGRNSQKQNEISYEQPFEKESPSETVNFDLDSQTKDKAGTILPIVDGTMAGKKMNYWIY